MPPLNSTVRSQLLDTYQSSNADNLSDNLRAYESEHPLNPSTKSKVDQIVRCWNRGGEVEECLDAEGETGSNVHWDSFSDEQAWEEFKVKLWSDLTNDVEVYVASIGGRTESDILKIKADFKTCNVRRGDHHGRDCLSELDMRRQLYHEAAFGDSDPPPVTHTVSFGTTSSPSGDRDRLSVDRERERESRRAERERTKPAREAARQATWAKIRKIFHPFVELSFSPKDSLSMDKQPEVVLDTIHNLNPFTQGDPLVSPNGFQISGGVATRFTDLFRVNWKLGLGYFYRENSPVEGADHLTYLHDTRFSAGLEPQFVLGPHGALPIIIGGGAALLHSSLTSKQPFDDNCDPASESICAGVPIDYDDYGILDGTPAHGGLVYGLVGGKIGHIDLSLRAGWQQLFFTSPEKSDEVKYSGYFITPSVAVEF